MKYCYTCKNCGVETVAENFLRCPICGCGEFSYEPYVEIPKGLNRPAWDIWFRTLSEKQREQVEKRLCGQFYHTDPNTFLPKGYSP